MAWEGAFFWAIGATAHARSISRRFPGWITTPASALKFRWQLNYKPQTGDYTDLDNIVLTGQVQDSGRLRSIKNLTDSTLLSLTGKVLYKGTRLRLYTGT